MGLALEDGILIADVMVVKEGFGEGTRGIRERWGSPLGSRAEEELEVVLVEEAWSKAVFEK